MLIRISKPWKPEAVVKTRLMPLNGQLNSSDFNWKTPRSRSNKSKMVKSSTRIG